MIWLNDSSSVILLFDGMQNDGRGSVREDLENVCMARDVTTTGKQWC